jgi:type I site-specific restriction-modification system R (restriction) subunit
MIKATELLETLHDELTSLLESLPDPESREELYKNRSLVDVADLEVQDAERRLDSALKDIRNVIRYIDLDDVDEDIATGLRDISDAVDVVESERDDILSMLNSARDAHYVFENQYELVRDEIKHEIAADLAKFISNLQDLKQAAKPVSSRKARVYKALTKRNILYGDIK